MPTKRKKRWWEVYGEKKKENTPMYTEEDEQRMDIIGQNGNDGIHYEKEVELKPAPKDIPPVEKESTLGKKGAFRRVK